MTTDAAEIKAAMSEAGNELSRAFSAFGKHLKQSANAHYHVMGKHTLPLSKNPPKPKDVSVAGQVLLFPIPLVANLLAITAFPLIGNSIKSFGHVYSRTVNLALLDTPDRQIKTTPDKRGADANGEVRPALWILQNAYGLPGAILGGALGLVSAAIVTLARIIMSTFVSGARAFVSAVNLYSDKTEDEIKLTGLKKEYSLDRDQRRSYYDMFVLGAPGIAVGGALGLMGGFLAHTFKHSAISTARTIKSMLKVSLYKSDWAKDWDPETLKDNDWKNNIVGFPGFIIGAVIGTIASTFVLLARLIKGIWPMIKNSMITAGLTIKTMTNAALADSEKYAPKVINAFNEDNRETHQKVIGAPGFLLGSIIGTVSMTAVLAWRFLVNNVQTAWQVMVTMTNAVLPKPPRQPWEKMGIFNQKEQFERPKYWRYGIAAPGLLIGAVIGLIPAFLVSAWRVISHTALITGRMVATMVKGALYDSHGFKNLRDYQPFKNQTREDNIFGFAGYGIGSLIGAITFAAIGVWRFIVNNVQSGWQTAKLIATLAREKKYRKDWKTTGILDPNEKFTREKYWRYGIAAPGIGIGFVFGAIAAGFITLGRAFKHSAKTSGRLIRTMLHGVLYDTKNKRIQNWLKDKDGISNNTFDDNLWGAPGFLIGGILGAVSVTAVAAWRFLINTVQTTWQMIKSMVNAVLPKPPRKNWKEAGIAKQDEMFPRTKYWRYGIASPGLLIGAVVGVIPAALVSVWRVIYHSAITTGRVVKAFVKGALYDSHQFKPMRNIKPFKNQTKEDIGFGLPGFYFGTMFGMVSFAAISVWRFIVNNVQTAWQMINSMTYAVLPKRNNLGYKDVGIFAKENLPYSREKHWRYGIAAPGILIGAVLGTISAFFAGFGRFVYYSAVNTKRMARLFVKGALLDSDRYKEWATNKTRVLESDKDIRDNTLEETLLGMPGLAIGSIAGAISFVAVTLWRFVINNVQSGWQMAASMANAVLPSKKRKESDEVGLFNKDPKFKRTNLWRYGIGFPGIAIGAVIGSVVSLALGFTGFIVHGFKSWQALSGSMMNGALNRRRFAGLGGDERKNHEKALGALGYVFAMLTLPIALSVALVRKIPYALFFLAGLVLLPLTAAVRGLLKKSRGHRFDEKNSNEDDPVEKAFKNLNSALNGWGKLVQGAKISDGENGKKGGANTARKLLMFNIKSSTERVLDGILDRIRKLPRIDRDLAVFFKSGAYTNAVKAVKDKYAQEKNIFINEEERAEKLAEIDTVAEFVKDYVLDYATFRNDTQNKDKAYNKDKSSVPSDFYSRNKKYSWSATMWGGKPKQENSAEGQQATVGHAFDSEESNDRHIHPRPGDYAYVD